MAQSQKVQQTVITASTSSNTRLVQCVGISNHEKLGYKIRFSGKPEATSRISTLIATKLHSDIRFINLTEATTEVEAAVELYYNDSFADEAAQYAITSFLEKCNATDVQAAHDAYNADAE